MAGNASRNPPVKQSIENHEARKHSRRGMDTRSSHEGTSSGHSSRYHIIKTIGKGNFAKVKLARHILTGQEVAIKIIDKTHMNPTSLQKLRREVKIMKLLDHPNIVKLYEVIETEKTLNLVMEYASRGELFDYLVANGRMKEKDARVLFRQIISAIQYCHQKRILHRDLKAENLLLDEDLNVKIADFGFSNEFSLNSKLDTFCGSPPYAAPELFQGKKYDGPEVDVWSLGVILYTLVSGSLPFDGQNLKELRERVLRGKYRIPFYMTTDCENLLKKFLILNPLKRATLETIMKDLWLNTGYEDSKLKPFHEPPVAVDSRIFDKMVLLGFKRREVEDSFNNKTYNHLMASYLLLCRQATITRASAGGSGGDYNMPLLVNKTASVLRATSLTDPTNNKIVHNNNNNNKNSNNNHNNNNKNNKNNIINNNNNSGINNNNNDNNNNNTILTSSKTTQPQKPPTTTDLPSSKVSRSASAATSHVDKRILRKDMHDNLHAIQKTPNDTRLNETTSTTTTTLATATPTTITADQSPPTSNSLHYSINVPQARSSNPTSNHIASNFSRGGMNRTTMPPSAMHSNERMASKDSLARINQSVVEETDSHFITPSISRSTRKSFLHRISSKFYRNKSNRKSEGMMKSQNTNHNKPTQQLQSTPTSAIPTKRSPKDLNNSFAFIDQPSNHFKHSNETFTSITTNSTTTTTDKTNKPRALHFTWHLRNTSHMEADKMIHEIRQVLDVNHCDYYQTTPFVVHCSHISGDNDHTTVTTATKGTSHVEWVMEVCRLPRLSMNGVKFKRVTGSPLIYKNIITKISHELKF